jgi:hypothetical protein
MTKNRFVKLHVARRMFLHNGMCKLSSVIIIINSFTIIVIIIIIILFR